MTKNNIFITAGLMSIILLVSCDAFAAPSANELIKKSPALSDSEIISINTSLSKANLKEYFILRGALNELGIDKLYLLKERVLKNSVKKLQELIDNILSEKEEKSLYLLEEDIRVNHKPGLASTPLGGPGNRKVKIKDLKPDEEYLYFENLPLRYTENKLSAKTDSLWAKVERPKKAEKINTSTSFLLQNAGQFPSAGGQFKLKQEWAYRLTSDNLTDYLVNTRQWIKRYQEDALYPQSDQNIIILRNEHSLFGVDVLSGQQRWAFESHDKQGEEFYQTFRDRNHNSYGYQFLISQDRVFTALGKRLIAVKLQGVFMPGLLWETALGEYRVCTKPVLSGRTLCVGLINSKGELWIAGFDSSRGNLLWSTYVGINSFLSPACEISASKGNLVLSGPIAGYWFVWKPPAAVYFG